MDMSVLPSFWLAYLNDPSDSGRIHSNVRQRWLNGGLLLFVYFFIGDHEVKDPTKKDPQVDQ